MAKNGRVPRVYRPGREKDPRDQAARNLRRRRAEAIIADAINKAIAKHASEQAHFSKQDLVTEVCVATVTRGIDPCAIRARVEDTLRDGRFVSLGRHREQDRYATKEMYQAIESRAIEAAERLGARRAPAWFPSGGSRRPSPKSPG